MALDHKRSSPVAARSAALEEARQYKLRVTALEAKLEAAERELDEIKAGSAPRAEPSGGAVAPAESRATR